MEVPNPPSPQRPHKPLTSSCASAAVRHVLLKQACFIALFYILVTYKVLVADWPDCPVAIFSLWLHCDKPTRVPVIGWFIYTSVSLEHMKSASAQKAVTTLHILQWTRLEPLPGHSLLPDLMFDTSVLQHDSTCVCVCVRFMSISFTFKPAASERRSL